MRLWIGHLFVFAAVAATSCAANSVQPAEPLSTEALIRALQQQGVRVSAAESLPQSAHPYFSANARRLVVNGEDVQVFEYPTPARADSDASRVAPTGSPIGQTQVSWLDTPNFYKRDRLIVLYVGHASEVTTPLEAVLGRPFAAGR